MYKPIISPIYNAVIASISAGVIQSSVYAGTTLDINFLNEVLDPRITFTRASGSTRVNSNGFIESVSTDVPRFDYDPITLQPRGLLIEEQRTNLLTYSDQLDNAIWTKQAGSSVTANQTTSPDGTLSADLITANSGVGIYQNVIVAIGDTLCNSCFVKAGTATALMFRDDNGAGRHIVVSTSTWTVTSTSGTLINYGITPYKFGFYRIWMTYQSDTTQARCIVRPDSAGNNQTFYEWGCQIEKGGFPTSYIPSTASTVTRAADIATMTGTNFSSWYNQPEGTLFISYLLGLKNANAGVLLANDGTTNNGISVRYASGSQAQYAVTTGGVNQVNLAPAGYSSPGLYMRANAYKLNSFQQSINGVLPNAEDTAGTVPTVNQLNIGHEGGASVLCGHIRRITYVPRRLSNSELQAITS